MEIKVINNVPGLNVTINKSGDGSFAILLAEEKCKELGSKKPGSIAKIGNREYIVLGHAAETTAIITKDCAAEMEFGDTADYLTSKPRAYCIGDFYNELVEAVGKENIVKHTVKLMADDGTNKIVTRDNVSILTTELYRRYREFLPAIGKPYFTATRVSAEVPGYTGDVCCVDSFGVLYWRGCGWGYGVRPFCVLNSSVLVD